MTGGTLRLALIAIVASAATAAGTVSLLNFLNRPPATEAAETGPIGEVIHRYIVEHPEVITEAADVLRQRQQAARIEDASRRIEENRAALYEDAGSVVAGNVDGDVTMVEFFDYNCPYCKRVYPTLVQLREDDKGLRFIHKEFPILGPASVFAARAALASRNQNKYAELHDALMSRREKLTNETVLGTARAIGLDMERLERDMKDPEVDEIIGRNMDLAKRLQLTGTPSFVVGKTLIPGLADRAYLQSVIAEARAN